MRGCALGALAWLGGWLVAAAGVMYVTDEAVDPEKCTITLALVGVACAAAAVGLVTAFVSSLPKV